MWPLYRRNAHMKTSPNHNSTSVVGVEVDQDSSGAGVVMNSILTDMNSHRHHLVVHHIHVHHLHEDIEVEDVIHIMIHMDMMSLGIYPITATMSMTLLTSVDEAQDPLVVEVLALDVLPTMQWSHVWVG